jgi:hypothetical protein
MKKTTLHPVARPFFYWMTVWILLPGTSVVPRQRHAGHGVLHAGFMNHYHSMIPISSSIRGIRFTFTSFIAFPFIFFVSGFSG